MLERRFNPPFENIRMSPIVSISEEVRERAKLFEESGREMIRFQRGEIDFATPSFIVDAAKEALDKGLTKYPKSGGESFFKSAVINRLNRDFGVTDLTEENVVATYGGQEGLELSFKLFKSGAGFSPTWSCALENCMCAAHRQSTFGDRPCEPPIGRALNAGRCGERRCRHL